MGRPQKLQELAEALLFRYRYFVISLVLGIALFAFGAAILGSNLFEETKVEVLGSETVGAVGKIKVEIAGQVQSPAVYELEDNSRVDELLIKAGGLGEEADRAWVEKNLNRASKLVDGQKVYIPKLGESTAAVNLKSSLSTKSTADLGGIAEMININSASLKELDSLSGIGAVRAQAIIDNRPYGSIEELVSKKVLPKSVFAKIKDQIIAQ